MQSKMRSVLLILAVVGLLLDDAQCYSNRRRRGAAVNGAASRLSDARVNAKDSKSEMTAHAELDGKEAKDYEEAFDSKLADSKTRSALNEVSFMDAIDYVVDRVADAPQHKRRQHDSRMDDEQVDEEDDEAALEDGAEKK